MEMYYKAIKLADMNLLMSEMNSGIYEFKLVIDKDNEKNNILLKILKWIDGLISYESLSITDELYLLKNNKKFTCDFRMLQVKMHNSKYVTGGVDKIIVNIVGLIPLSSD